MSAHPNTGSPAARPRSTQFAIHDEGGLKSPAEHQALAVCVVLKRPIDPSCTDFYGQSKTLPSIVTGDTPAPLVTSKMGNLQIATGAHVLSGYKVGPP